MNYFHKDNQVHYYNDLQIQEGYADELTPLTEHELEVLLNPPVPTEQLAEQLRTRRDNLIADIRWRVERHHDQVALGNDPTEPIEPILHYVQALRDVPQQEGFPENVAWPEVPKERKNED